MYYNLISLRQYRPFFNFKLAYFPSSMISCFLVSTILDVMKATKDITDWNVLGPLLGLPEHHILRIEADTRNERREQQQKIIEQWLNSGTATWAVLVSALRDELVGRDAIANEIAKKYPESKYAF